MVFAHHVRRARLFGINAALATRRRIVQAWSRRSVRRRAEPRLVVYTAIIGGRDRLIDPTVITPDCRYVCFTDQPFQSEVWEIVRVPSSDNPRKASRYFKMKPHLLFDTEYSFWIDASFRINVDVRRLIARHLPCASIAAFAHYQRDCTYEHAEHHIAIGTGGNPDVVRRQM